jgi:hypothetical protein
MKQNKKNIKLKVVEGMLILFTILLVIPACQERLDEMNKNPNALTEIPAEFLFTNAVRGTFRSGLDGIQLDFGAQYGHLAISGDWERQVDTYEEEHMRGDVTQNVFNDVYKGAIKYCSDILLITAPDGDVPNEVQYALTDIVAVMNFAKLTDFFGDIPYFEGGLGKEGVFLPKYDKQEDIYADMVDRLKKDMDVLKSADFSNAFPGADPIYDNDKASWIRFANSLRLRLAMRARFVDSGKYNAIITECLSEELIEENEHNATLQHWDSDVGDLYNPWYNKYRDRYESGIYNFNVSEKYVDFLKNSNDPRLEVMVEPNKDGEYVGMLNGLIEEIYGAYKRRNASMPSLAVLAKDQPLYFMTASEIWFLRAEAALFNLGAGDANQLYQMGINKAMEQWNISQTDIDDYFANSVEGELTGSDEQQFEQIGYQMWVGFVPNYVESWFNMRRTGYPAIPRRTAPELAKGVTNGYMPTRLRYPQTTERIINGENMQEAIDRLGSDNIDARVWWDVLD